MLNDFKVLLTQYTHPNLITCYGAYYEEGTIKIILELMDFGSFHNLIVILKELYGKGPTMPENVLAVIVKQVFIKIKHIFILECKFYSHSSLQNSCLRD